MDPRWRALLAFAVDLLAVGVFVAIGRASHREDQSDFLVTYWPFAIGLAVGWLVARGWHRPFAVVRTAIPAWVAAVVVGMLLRALSGQGVQPAFVVVAAIVIGAFLVGWRVVRIALDRSATRGADTPGPIGYFLRRR